MSLVQTDYGLIYSTNGSLCATLRPGEGRFGGAMAVEEGTTNLLTTRTAPAQEVVAVSKGQKYTLSAYGNGNAMVYQQHVDDTQSDWQQGTLDGVVATAAGDLELAMLPGLYFDGVDDHVVVPNHAGLRFGTGSFTLEAIIRLDAYGSKNSAIISKRQRNETGSPQFKFSVSPSGELVLSTHYNQGSGIQSPPGLIAPGNVYHVAAVRDANGQHTLLINGQVVAQETLTVRNVTNNQPLWFGDDNRDNYSTPHGPYMFKGIITEVRVWNRSRTPTEIQNDMFTQLSGTENGLVGYWPLRDGSGTTVYDLSPSTANGTVYSAATPSSTWIEGILRNADGSRTSPVLDLSPVGTAAGSSISWTATTPEGTSVTVETNLSLDGGQTWQGWQQATNGGPIPGISAGTDLSNTRLQTKVTLQTTDPTVTPRVDSLTVEVGHQAVAVAAESLSQSSPLTFTAVGNRVRLVPSAGVTKWQLEQKPFATSFVPGTREHGRLVYPTSVFNPEQGTVSMWVCKHQLIDYNARVFWSESSSRRFGIHDNRSGGLTWAYVTSGSGVGQISGGFLTPGTWHHLVMTWHRDEGWMRGYLDGEPVVLLTFNPGTNPGFVHSNTWGLGAKVDGSQVFNGLFDELLILPYAADEQEIQSWYQNGIIHVRKPSYYASFDDSLALQYLEVVYDYRIQNNRIIFTEAPKPEDHILAFYEAAD